jgi:hypothetical protein
MTFGVDLFNVGWTTKRKKKKKKKKVMGEKIYNKNIFIKGLYYVY